MQGSKKKQVQERLEASIVAFDTIFLNFVSYVYTNNPTTPPIPLATCPYSTTLRPPWWTLPEDERRCCKHAFTKTSNQIRLEDRNATLRSLHHKSHYIRLILKAKDQGARAITTGTALHSYIRKSPKDGIAILKFLYGQLYKLQPTDACTLCGLPDSCAHIARECKSHNNQCISKHKAACQLTHTTIITAFNGVGTIRSPHNLK